ncbi:ribosome small subunit-dependent GTPase A [Cohnella nanjingensis]|uniref:Small ribosomal subunit biogenesis GTPase RsgA n=1 Tax=Cohnella nanjingensis TaxID=1387779 RepID=A0A7X0RP07_9BACL|nr:ribosome small subunit-dependent GTPase A [Cohnella nanjingensis]MBB6671027.1 ribosome small subunit-dependent GTPase A [Cohnella nanjingensis]
MNPKEMNERLTAWGWNEAWEGRFDASVKPGARKLVPARVTAQFSHLYQIVAETGERYAEVTGKFEFEAESRGAFPAVGDWVAAELLDGEPRAVIHAVLPRMSAMSRKVAGNTIDEQIIGANLDTVFIVNSLNEDWNVRRLERYLIIAREAGIRPVVLLTKADLCADPEAYVAEAEQAAPGVPVIAVSAVTDQGKDALAPYLQTGMTVAATGSSGVGKSTLLNWLAGDDLQEVQGIREDDARGRHTTTHRELFVLPGGAIWLDTPGMRELQLWDSQGGWQETFADIETLAASCRFADCRHESEHGCAVRAALNDGTLDASRYVNYRKTERELARLARKEQSASKRQLKQAASRGGRGAGKKTPMNKRDFIAAYDEE